MNVHNGMRPQDIIVLLKFAFLKEPFPVSLVAASIGIAPSELSKSIQRSRYSGLITTENKVAVRSLLGFIQYGLPYVFPVKPASITRGIPTAYSHPILKDRLVVSEDVVWPHAEGEVRGAAIEPLYPALPNAVLQDKNLYLAAALTDVFRIGRSRDKAIAIEFLENLLIP